MLWFIKMEGCGNDYVFIDCFKAGGGVRPARDVIIKMSDRNFGIGGDGVVLICRSKKPGCDGRMRMFNADGSEGNMCGNAIRCVAKYLYEDCGIKKRQMRIETRVGEREVEVMVRRGCVVAARVNMGRPFLDEDRDLVNIGNLHRIIKWDGAISDVTFAGCQSGDPWNTEFFKVTGDNEIKMRVHERGSGETMACGTGACSVAWWAANVEKVCDPRRPILVKMRGGTLTIDIAEDGEVYMTGECKKVFEGVWND